MPLRDHFHGAALKQATWEGIHGQWPAAMVLQLFDLLPEGFRAEPRVRLGQHYEVDIGAFDANESMDAYDFQIGGSGGTATALLAPPRPTWSVETEFAEEYQYEVLIFDDLRDRQLVAAIELVSPGNKDRPKARQAFVNKCLVLLKQGVCVSLVDLVTNRQFNLYTKLLAALGKNDPTLNGSPHATYAVTCRTQPLGMKYQLDNWYYPMVVGQPLPTLPLWLGEQQVIYLDLEPSFEETCRVLKVR